MKFCPKCGAECEDNASFCSICGNKLPESGFRPNNAFEENGENSQSSRNYNNSYNNDSETDQGRTFGILSLVFGIIGINLLGIIFGIIGISKSKDSSSKTMNIVGLAISIIHMIVQVIITILAYKGIISGYFYI